MFSQIARREEQIGSIGAIVQMPQHLIEPLAVEFDRIVGIEAQMDVGNLCDQQSKCPLICVLLVSSLQFWCGPVYARH